MKDLVTYERTETTWQDQFDKKRTIGERAADNVAKFGGSWRFVLALLSVLVGWMVINIVLNDLGTGGAWDPYPFIALNLMLSMVAAFQGKFFFRRFYLFSADYFNVADKDWPER